MYGKRYRQTKNSIGRKNFCTTYPGNDKYKPRAFIVYERLNYPNRRRKKKSNGIEE
jgi:hypothetical protein